MHILKIPTALANDPLTWDGVMSLVICTDVALNYVKI